MTIPKEPGPTPPETSERQKRLKDWVAPAAVIGGIGLLISSYKVGQESIAPLEKALREQIKAAEAQLKETQKELETTQQDLQACRDLGSTGGKPPMVAAEISVNENVGVFSQELFISVLSIQPNSDAAGFQVTARLKAAGKESAPMEGTAGDSLSYSGFEIRITDVRERSAYFLVRKLTPPTSNQP